MTLYLLFKFFCLSLVFFFPVIQTYTGRNVQIHTQRHTYTHTLSMVVLSLAAPLSMWKTSCLWAPVEMTALSLISLSTVQTSPNYSHCLPLRWHAHWIIDGHPAPVSLKVLPMGTHQPMDRYLPTHPLCLLYDSSLNYYANSNLFSWQRAVQRKACHQCMLCCVDVWWCDKSSFYIINGWSGDFQAVFQCYISPHFRKHYC